MRELRSTRDYVKPKNEMLEMNRVLEMSKANKECGVQVGAQRWVSEMGGSYWKLQSPRTIVGAQTK